MPYPRMIKDAVQAIGAERVLFASDGPGCDPTLELEKLRRAKLSPADEALVLHGNIERMLGLGAR